MSDPTLSTIADLVTGDDIVLPFAVPGLGVRGRIVRLSGVVDEILSQHDHPEPIGHLIGEALALAALLGATMKFEGRFILQAQGDGPISLLIVDYTVPGHLRAHCRYNPDRVSATLKDQEPESLLGEGTLALTIDQGADMHRYQGIVALEGQSLSSAARGYFRQSEQIPTEIALACGKVYTPPVGQGNGTWRAGGIIIQHLPQDGGSLEDAPPLGSTVEDDPDQRFGGWDEARSLFQTMTADELLDPGLSAERLAYRLFHESGVRAFEEIPLSHVCRCSRERIENIIRQFSEEEMQDMIEDGMIKVVCEFCAKNYSFDPADFAGAGSLT